MILQLCAYLESICIGWDEVLEAFRSSVVFLFLGFGYRIMIELFQGKIMLLSGLLLFIWVKTSFILIVQFICLDMVWFYPFFVPLFLLLLAPYYILLTFLIAMSLVRDGKGSHYVYTWILKPAGRNQEMRISLLVIMPKTMSKPPMLDQSFIRIGIIICLPIREM